MRFFRILSFQIPGDGSCQFNAAFSQIYLDPKIVEDGSFDCEHFKLQIIAHACMNIELVAPHLKPEILGIYGNGKPAGPFSLKGWLRYHISKRKVWGDGGTLGLLASGTSQRITIVYANTGAEVRLRHDKPINEVDIVLIFNGSEASGHYSSVIWSDGNTVTATSPKPVEGYSEVDAVKERGASSEEVVVISKQLYDKLRWKERIVDEFHACYGINPTDVVPPRVGRRAKTRKEKLIAPPESSERPRKVQRVSEGDTECEHCKMVFENWLKLRVHVEKVHEGLCKEVCEKCDKKIYTKRGLKDHMAGHEAKAFRCNLTRVKKGKTINCDADFTLIKNFNKHNATYHTNKQPVACRFADQGCKFESMFQGDIKDHETYRCTKNPDKKPQILCEICPDDGKYSFSLPRDLARHYREVHNL